jgi:hypothetical protein
MLKTLHNEYQIVAILKRIMHCTVNDKAATKAFSL